MNSVRSLVLVSIVCVLVFGQFQHAKAYPASSFTSQYEEGYVHWYDNYGIDRTYYGGPNGYLPNLASETLGDNKELAYSIGQSFLANYPSQTDRAVAILKYVQRWTEYGYDSDNVVEGGIAQEEWAWNADEMAHNFSETTGAVAIGDCEDMAFLCGTIYVGAGFDAAVIDATDHAALLIWLPDFSNANAYWDLQDGRGAGWIWVEATGSSNPLGWTPPDYQDGGWTAYPINTLSFVPEEPTQSTSTTSIPIDTNLLLTIVIAVISIILALAKGRRA